MRVALLGIVGVMAIAACGSSTPSAQPRQISVNLVDSQGSSVGTATLSAGSVVAPSTAGVTPGPTPISGNGTPVHFHVEAKGLTPGSHGFSIHAVGKCDAPTFATSGPEFNPSGGAHGFEVSGGPANGDLPNIPVGTDGNGVFDFTTTLVTLDAGATNSLDTPNGTSLLVTRGTDEMRNDGAEGRDELDAKVAIACGVIFAAPQPTPTPTPGPTPTPTPTPSPTSGPTPTRLITPPPTSTPTNSPTPPPTPTAVPSPT